LLKLPSPVGLLDVVVVVCSNVVVVVVVCCVVVVVVVCCCGVVVVCLGGLDVVGLPPSFPSDQVVVSLLLDKNEFKKVNKTKQRTLVKIQKTE
jgi:hypothetical protein